MCGRFILTLDFDRIVEILTERFNIESGLNFDFSPRYNIAPSQNVLSIIHDGNKYRAGYLKWGFVPSWSKDEKIGYKMINARCETIDEKPSYKDSFVTKRCLILTNGFYEWKRENESKKPMLIKLKDNSLFTMAGLYSMYRDEQGNKKSSCTIITTTPNELMSNIHDRMPVIFDRQKEKLWLESRDVSPSKLKSLLTPYPSEKMDYYEVSSLVNSPKNDTIECIEKIS